MRRARMVEIEATEDAGYRTMERALKYMEQALERLEGVTEVVRAAHHARSSDEATLATQIEISEIPAPPFEEGRRATRLAELMGDAGLDGIRIDEVGNVLGERAGATEGSPLVVSAHLDTVFPPGTDVGVVREGDLLRGPGISDDARGLAVLLALARALEAGGVRTRSPLLFAGTVGEEGIGDLRGVRHLFGTCAPAERAGGFLSLDGAGMERLVTRGLGSRRFRIVARGPGGHSWVDWGTANPIHVLGGLVRHLTSRPLSRRPLTTLTVARWGGGKSINAIPQEAWIEVDVRSERDHDLEVQHAAIAAAVAERVDRSAGLTVEVEVIGHRPGGETPADAPLVQAAVAATRARQWEPRLACSSTDANIPMSLGIPALTMGCGGEAGQAHTTEEWYRNVRGTDGTLRALFTVLLAAGADGVAGSGA